MPRRLVKLFRLSRPEQLLIAEATVALLAVTIGLRVGGVRRCADLVGAVRPAAAPPTEELVRIGLAVQRASGPLRSSCLSQSLAVMWLLGRRGVATELRFGARLAQGALDAHAWVAAPDLGWTFDVDPAAGYVPLQSG